MVDEDTWVSVPWTTWWHRHLGVRTGDQQGAVLLIAATRADQVSSELAHQTFETTEQLQELTTRDGALIAVVERLTLEVHAATVGRPPTDGPAATRPAPAPAPPGEPDVQ